MIDIETMLSRCFARSFICLPFDGMEINEVCAAMTIAMIVEDWNILCGRLTETKQQRALNIGYQTTSGNVFIHAKDSGYFGRNSNGRVLSGFFPTRIIGITSGGGLLILVGIFRPKFAVPFLTNRFFALSREFGKGLKSGKSHSYWFWPGLIGKCRSIFIGYSH